MMSTAPSSVGARTPGYLRVAGWTLAALILLVPAVAMQFTPQVRWGSGDFLLMGGLLLLVGGTIEAISRCLPAGRGVRWGMAGMALLIFLAIWAELAVGIFD